MNVHVEYGPEFKRQFKRLAKKYHSLKSDYESWLDEIYKNPLVGDDLGGGVHKIRMAIADKGKGKSGGARILTLNVKVSEDGMNVTLLIRRCHLNCRMLLPYAGWDRLGIAVYSLQLIVIVYD